MRAISIQLFPKRTQGARRRMATLPARMTAFALEEDVSTPLLDAGHHGKIRRSEILAGKVSRSHDVGTRVALLDSSVSNVVGAASISNATIRRSDKGNQQARFGRLNRRMSASPRVMTSRLAAVGQTDHVFPPQAKSHGQPTTRPWLVVPTVRRNLTIEMVGQTVPQRLHPMYRAQTFRAVCAARPQTA